jgi:hypothetical protein
VKLKRVVVFPVPSNNPFFQYYDAMPLVGIRGALGADAIPFTDMSFTAYTEPSGAGKRLGVRLFRGTKLHPATGSER